MSEIDEIAVRAATDPVAAEELILSQRWFLLRCCADCCHRFVTDSDDEFSVAMLAFSDAIASFSPEKGGFVGWARLVIKSRLTDYMRKNYGRAELSVPPEVFEGRVEGELSGVATAVQTELNRRAISLSKNSAAEEIQAANETFSKYGFSFFDLASCSPKAEKTRQSCKIAVRAILSSDELFAHMTATRTLPMKKLEEICDLPRKILERHRKYIIAAVELLAGEYPHLSEYLSFIKKEEHR